MPPTLNTEQEFFRETTERFLSEQMPLTKVRLSRDDPSGFDRDYWRRGAELGWTSLLVSERHGGGTISGLGLVDLSLVAYEFGRHAAPGPFIPANVVASILSAHDSHVDVLSDILSGDAVVSWCGPDLTLGFNRPKFTTALRHEGSQIVVSGQVRMVESAEQADYLLVSAEEAGGATQILIPATAAGVTMAPMDTVDLTRRFSVVTFADVAVGPEAVVGEAGHASADIDRQFDVMLALLNAEAVGTMQAVFDMTVEWSFDRYSFGRPLASYQALKHRFADMLTWLEASHAISDGACLAFALESPDASEMLSAGKAFIGQYGAELMQDCVQLHGGIGVTFEHDLHLFLRRFTVDRGLAGAPGDHRQRIGQLQRDRGVAA
jgi:alkylation response protein AidB-like acyl-CoA dehydrogenase